MCDFHFILPAVTPKAHCDHTELQRGSETGIRLDSNKFIQPKKRHIFGVYKLHIYNYHIPDYQNDILDSLSAQEPRA